MYVTYYNVKIGMDQDIAPKDLKDAEIKFEDKIMTFNDDVETKVNVRHLNDYMRPYKSRGIRKSTYKIAFFYNTKGYNIAFGDKDDRKEFELLIQQEYVAIQNSSQDASTNKLYIDDPLRSTTYIDSQFWLEYVNFHRYCNGSVSSYNSKPKYPAMGQIFMQFKTHKKFENYSTKVIYPRQKQNIRFRSLALI